MNKDKKTEILKVSNPDLVYHNAVYYLGNTNFQLELSTRKNKKYMIKSEVTDNKWVHFGDINYEDYTKHKNKEQRHKFKIRNKHWLEKYDIYSPSWFSWYFLW